MATRVNAAARTAQADGVVDLVDGGSGAGVLRIYTGAQPAGPGSAPTGTLLVELPLSDPAFSAAGAGVATLDITPPVSAVAVGTGTAGWWRFCDSTEAAGAGLGVIDGLVTASGGGGELILPTTAITTGLVVTIGSGTVTAPAST
ncbi:hypothetical protein [Micromonospora sp. NPDC004704]